jgi:hypothetical protein
VTGAAHPQGRLDAERGRSAAGCGALGPRTAGREAQYERLLGEIAHGARLHYGEHSEDPDLDLLLGDQHYASGLARLAVLGDLEATAELADVISLVAQAHAAADPKLADAVWEAGKVAIGWGPSEAHEAAKHLARMGAPGARQALLAAAARRCSADR